MFLLIISQHGYRANLMLSHSWILLLLFLIIILILIIIRLVFYRLIFREIRAEITIRTVTAITVSVVVTTAAVVIAEDKGGWMIVISGGSDVHIDDVAEVAKDVVEEVEVAAM